jgi:hypothetical protein
LWEVKRDTTQTKSPPFSSPRLALDLHALKKQMRHWTFLFLFTSILGIGQSLEHGHAELAVLAGGTLDTSSIFNKGKFAVGGQVAVGLDRHWAATFNYVVAKHEQGICLFLCPPPDRTLHEFMGGARFSLLNRARVAPYLTGTIGGIRSISSSFASGVGAGLEVRATKRSGVLVDLRGIYAVSPHAWLVRGTGGYYVRF